LCVKVDRHTKTKKSIFCNLEIIHLREKDYPVEVVEPKGWSWLSSHFSEGSDSVRSDTVIEFAWEPKGDRFIITSTNDPNFGNTAPGVPIKTEVHFYQLDKSKDDFRPLSISHGRPLFTVY
jgi:translation initiation factor 3 subunit B